MNYTHTHVAVKRAIHFETPLSMKTNQSKEYQEREQQKKNSWNKIKEKQIEFEKVQCSSMIYLKS